MLVEARARGTGLPLVLSSLLLGSNVLWYLVSSIVMPSYFYIHWFIYSSSYPSSLALVVARVASFVSRRWADLLAFYPGSKLQYPLGVICPCLHSHSCCGSNPTDVTGYWSPNITLARPFSLDLHPTLAISPPTREHLTLKFALRPRRLVGCIRTASAPGSSYNPCRGGRGGMGGGRREVGGRVNAFTSMRINIRYMHNIRARVYILHVSLFHICQYRHSAVKRAQVQSLNSKGSNMWCNKGEALRSP